MDDSQSSDMFSETSVGRFDLSTTEVEMYDLLVSKIKTYALKSDARNVLEEPLTVLLEDCRSCILQSLDLIHSFLEDANPQMDKLCNYLDDAVCILKILSNCIKTMIASVAITCSEVKNFSTCTGNIILSVFTHCKDSEYIYGNSLSKVEKQLKDLFRNCHELQMIYLMALEKHLTFDLTEKQDREILDKTLEINLKICDVVQSLDVKTMAEQWKAYTIICEKYSSFLVEKNIFNTSSTLLASTIERNIATALEASEEDKIVLRSLKVASFSLKILLRICNIFKCSAANKYETIVKLLSHTSLCNSSYYEVAVNKSSEFLALLDTHVSTPSEVLIAALMNETNFLKLIFVTESGELEDSELLGHMLLVASVMRAVVENKSASSDDTDKVIACVFSYLPHCHKWFNVGLKLKHKTLEGRTQYYGLYEHLLLHTVTLTTMFTPEQYNKLENYLYEALLGTEYYSAIFASNLWILLCRLGDNQLRLDVLLGLLKVYQQLESHASFAASPQQIHLTHTIEKLFETLCNSDKMLIYKQFSVKDVSNFGVWSAMKISNLPRSSIRISMEGIVDDSLAKFHEVLNDNEGSLQILIKHLKLLSTCEFVESDPRIEDLLTRAWLKACPRCNSVLQRRLDDRSVWLFRYLEGLASLTESYVEKFERNNSLVTILHVISSIVQVGNIETVHLLFKLFCKLSKSLLENQNDAAIATLFTNTTRRLLDDSDDIRQYIISVTVSDDDDISELITPILKDSKATWNKFVEQKKIFNTKEWHKQLEFVVNNKYIHKCMEISDVDEQEQECMEINDNMNGLRKSKSNFDLGDIDSLFDESEGEEPISKKAKMDFDIGTLIGKIETDVEQLCQSKENILSEYKGRIKCVCDKLRNIVS